LEKKAYRVDGPIKAVTVVAEGPLFGVWTWNKKAKRLSYSIQIDASTFCFKNKNQIADTGVPKWVFSVLVGENRKWFEAFKVKGGRSAIARWKVFAKQHELQGITSDKHIFERLAGYTFEDTVADKDKLDFLFAKIWLIKEMGVKKRALFVQRVTRFGPKKALRLSFPKADGVLVNSLLVKDWNSLNNKSLSYTNLLQQFSAFANLCLKRGYRITADRLYTIDVLARYLQLSKKDAVKKQYFYQPN
jgi:hypothetical protein